MIKEIIRERKGSVPNFLFQIKMTSHDAVLTGRNPFINIQLSNVKIVKKGNDFQSNTIKEIIRERKSSTQNPFFQMKMTSRDDAALADRNLFVLFETKRKLTIRL